MMYNCNNDKTILHIQQGDACCKQSNHIYNYFKSLKLGLILSDVYHNHLMTIMVSIFLCGYRGKTIDFAEVSCQHRTTTASHTKPSSQALHPIEAAYFHQSHLKGCQDYGHQVVSVMLSCNGIILNYAVILYDRSKLKIRIVQEIASCGTCDLLLSL